MGSHERNPEPQKPFDGEGYKGGSCKLDGGLWFRDPAILDFWGVLFCGGVPQFFSGLSLGLNYTVDDKSCITLLMDRNYGNYGIFLIMGNAGFISSTVFWGGGSVAA